MPTFWPLLGVCPPNLLCNYNNAPNDHSANNPVKACPWLGALMKASPNEKSVHVVFSHQFDIFRGQNAAFGNDGTTGLDLSPLRT